MGHFPFPGNRHNLTGQNIGCIHTADGQFAPADDTELRTPENTDLSALGGKMGTDVRKILTNALAGLTGLDTSNYAQELILNRRIRIHHLNPPCGKAGLVKLGHQHSRGGKNPCLPDTRIF